MAECSESTGTISPPPRSRARTTTGPAAMRLSLLARASRLPASRAATVAGRTARPKGASDPIEERVGHPPARPPSPTPREGRGSDHVEEADQVVHGREGE